MQISKSNLNSPSSEPAPNLPSDPGKAALEIVREARANQIIQDLKAELNERVIVFIGAPASGKGTLGKWLGEHGGNVHTSSGSILREQREQGTELGQKIAPYLDKGEIAPADLVMPFLSKHLGSVAIPLILDGIPRALDQIPYMDDIIEQRKSAGLSSKLLIVEICVAKETAEARMLGRNREDDTQEIFNDRWEAYNNITRPLIQHYSARGEDIVRVDSIDSLLEVKEALASGLQACLAVRKQ